MAKSKTTTKKKKVHKPETKESLEKKYPNLSSDELTTLLSRPEAILPGMFETPEEFEAARSQHHAEFQQEHKHLATGTEAEETEEEEETEG